MRVAGRVLCAVCCAVWYENVHVLYILVHKEALATGIHTPAESRRKHPGDTGLTGVRRGTGTGTGTETVSVSVVSARQHRSNIYTFT